MKVIHEQISRTRDARPYMLRIQNERKKICQKK